MKIQVQKIKSASKNTKWVQRKYVYANKKYKKIISDALFGFAKNDGRFR